MPVLALAALALGPLAAPGASSAPPAPTTWYVDASAPGPGDGTPANPYRSVQVAIDAASTLPGDTLQLAPGTYFEWLDLHGKALRFVGDPLSRPRLVAVGAHSVVRAASNEGPGIEFEDLVLTAGTGSTWMGARVGGGAYLDGQGARFTRCLLEDNEACSAGGAIFVLNGSLRLVDCELRRNRAGSGGGVHLRFGQLEVEGCTFEDNEALTLPGCGQTSSSGGAVFVSNGSAALWTSSFRRNTAVDRGGAGFLDTNSPGHLVDRCVFDGNGQRLGQTVTGDAGALYGGHTVVTASTFLNNRARSNGGAVSEGSYSRCRFEHNAAATGGAAYSATLEECLVLWNDAISTGGSARGGGSHSCRNVLSVFFGNSCADDAGACANALEVSRCSLIGSFGHPAAAAAQGAAVRNSLVWGNRALGGALPTTQVASATVEYSLVEGLSGGPGNVCGLPLLFGAHVGDAHLLPGSPAIDAADPALPPDSDGSRADIGALPYDPAYRRGPATYCVAKTTAQGCVPALASLGLPSLTASGWELRVSGAPSGTLGLALLALDTNDAPFFGGRLCLGGPITRAVAAGTVPGGACGETLVFAMPPARTAATGALAGDLLFAQVWFRDALHPDGTGVGISDALVATVGP